jgi:hypothetical protein
MRHERLSFMADGCQQPFVVNSHDFFGRPFLVRQLDARFFVRGG